MAKIYAALIVKNKKTFRQIPDNLKERVREILIDMEYKDLIIE